MRSSRIAIVLLVTILVAAFAVPGAIACDKTKAAKAETASTVQCDPAKCDKAGCDPASCPKAAAAAATAETASATTAQAGSCASKTAATAAQAGTCASKTAAQTASTTQAGTCASKTAAQTAGATGCSKAASATTAGMGCSGSQASAAKYDIAVETVKLPSGALAVIYTGKDADSVAMLQSAANGTVADFGCPNVQKMVASENCTVEMASTEDGLMFLCTSDDVALIDSFQKNYEVAMATPVQEAEGE
jgi:hypothetical protein